MGSWVLSLWAASAGVAEGAPPLAQNSFWQAGKQGFTLRLVSTSSMQNTKAEGPQLQGIPDITARDLLALSNWDNKCWIKIKILPFP